MKPTLLYRIQYLFIPGGHMAPWEWRDHEWNLAADAANKRIAYLRLAYDTCQYPRWRILPMLPAKTVDHKLVRGYLTAKAHGRSLVNGGIMGQDRNGHVVLHLGGAR